MQIVMLVEFPGAGRDGPCSMNRKRRLGGGNQPQSDRTSEDEDQAADSNPISGFSKGRHAGNNGARGADAGPDGISRTERHRFQGQPKKDKTENDGKHGDGAGPETREPLRVLQSKRPNDFECAGHYQSEPGHRSSL